MNNQKFSDKILKKELRQKYSSKGYNELDEQEIIELLLSYSNQKDLKETADKLIKQYGSFAALADADINALLTTSDLSDQTVVLLKIIPFLSRIYYQENRKINILNSSKQAKQYFENYFIGALEEEFAVVCTDENLKITACKTMFKGSISEVKISCRDIVDFTLMNNSDTIFIAHNHPTGSAKPSANDYSATDMIYQTIKRFGITLIDHVIAGRNSVVSMRELPFTLPFKNEDPKGYMISEEE